MASAPAVYECKACHVRRDVTVVDDGASKPLPEDPDQRARYVRELLRHATCPACKAREPDAVAAQRRDVWRGRFMLAAFYAGVAAAAYFVPNLALIPPMLSLLIWSLVAKVRLRRGYWFAVGLELVMAIAMIVWVLQVPHLAYVMPAVVALLVLWPRRSSSDPFVDADEQLRFSETPYRG